MTDVALQEGEQVVRIIAQTVVDNEKYFCELDAVVGDGDFGYSLARGFEKLLDGWDELEYDDISTLLKKTALTLTSRVGGASGPIWGTAFLRAGVALAGKDAPTDEDVIAALRAAIEGVKQRGESDLGDKTLLDALIPAVDRLESELQAGNGTQEALAAAAATAREKAEGTVGMLAKKGRAAYSGERSLESPDAGAIAIAVLFESVSGSWTPSKA
jgi:dihydroxyacetone kinase phosphoprotein-dependent L subunit